MDLALEDENAEKHHIFEDFFREQFKFAILQTLVLLELMVTSSSTTIYGLGSAGAAVIWSFTFLARDDKAKAALGVFFPSLLFCSTMLLTVITLVKVNQEREQTDLSLVFLGVAFTTDNFLMTLDLIPPAVKFVLAGGSRQRVEGLVKGSKSGCKKVIRNVLDIVVLLIIAFVAILSIIIGIIHAVIVYPVYLVVNRFVMQPKFQAWVREEKTRRADEGTPMTNEEVQAETALRRILILFTCVLTVDCEFIAIAIGMAYYSGGANVGGTPFGENNNINCTPFASCCCDHVIIGNRSVC